MHPQLDPAVGEQFDKNGLEVLTPEVCVHLLRGATLGRVAVWDGSEPALFPVNFHFDGTRVLLRTGEGSKLAARLGDPVAFEVDEFDAMFHAGWSVLVVGRIDAAVDDDPHLPLVRWAPQGGGRLLAITPATVSGRRIPVGWPRATDGS